MFLGTHAPRLDEKGRLILPAKYRDELAGGVVITKGQERCLYVFPQEEFARITEALRTAPVTANGGVLTVDRGEMWGTVERSGGYAREVSTCVSRYSRPPA